MPDSPNWGTWICTNQECSLYGAPLAVTTGMEVPPCKRCGGHLNRQPAHSDTKEDDASEGAAPYEVGAVANFMIGRALRQRRPLTHLKLQKLVFLAYGFYRALTGERLFRERIEAWPYGPIVPELYHEFKRFANRPIDRWSSNFEYDQNAFSTPLVADSDDSALLALNTIWNEYGTDPLSQLVALTQRQGTPWDTARESAKKAGRTGELIDDGLIDQYWEEIWNVWEERFIRFNEEFWQRFTSDPEFARQFTGTRSEGSEGTD